MLARSQKCKGGSVKGEVIKISFSFLWKCLLKRSALKMWKMLKKAEGIFLCGDWAMLYKTVWSCNWASQRLWILQHLGNCVGVSRGAGWWQWHLQLWCGTGCYCKVLPFQCREIMWVGEKRKKKKEESLSDAFFLIWVMKNNTAKVVML